MIACEICESPQFLQITNSRFRVDHSSREALEVYEKYHCVFCGPTAVGALTINEDGEKHLTGGIIEIDNAQPRADI